MPNLLRHIKKQTKMEGHHHWKTSLNFSTIIIIPLLAFLLLVAKLVYSFWLKPIHLEKILRQQGIKGTSFKLFRGDMEEIRRSSMEALSKPMSLNHHIVPRVTPFYHTMLQKYGKVFMCWWERRPRLVIVDSELIRLILSDKNDEFVKPPQNPLVNILQLGIPTLVGQQWSKRRRIMAPAFHLEKLKQMLPAFSTSCCSLIERWKELTRFQESIEVDVMQEFHILTVDIISRTAFGSCYEEGKKIFELQKQQFALLFEAYNNIYIPGFRFIPTKENKKRYELDNKIKAILHDLIRNRIQAKQTQETNLLDLLLQNTKLGNDNIDENDCLSINDVIEECKLFYIAGQETSANLLTWTMVVLSMHPNWQEKAREEVLQLCGMKIPTFEAINHFKIVSMILNEVLRLYPPVSIQSRYTKQETRVGEMKIPTGVELTLSIVSLHHDPEYWGDDAEEFNPERFSEGVGKASKAFYPFGWGPRICLGQNFAMIEVKMGLAMILQNFSFQLSPSYIHSPRNGVSLHPQHGVPIIFHPLINCE